MSLRLADSEHPRQGRLEIFHAGSWGTVCDINFREQDAQIACSQLGYGYVGELLYGYYGPGTGRIWLTNVQCNDSDSALGDCSHSEWGSTSFYYRRPGSRYSSYAYCRHSNDVSIACYNESEGRNATKTARLVDQTGERRGRLEVHYGGRWGAVCYHGFDDADARVACYSLGYGRVGYIINTYTYDYYYGRYHSVPNENRSSLVLLDHVSCAGYESTLLACSSTRATYNQSLYCSPTYAEQVWISCSNDNDTEDEIEYRLSDRYGQHYGGREGRLEIRHNGIWGTVCDDGFDDNAAQVACNALGFGHIGYSMNNYYGGGSGRIWLDDVSCYGTENSLDECRHRSWGSNNCGHYEDISIGCYNATNATELRLVGSYSLHEGRLQVRHRNTWGSVCNDAFNDIDAQVACYQLGYGRVGKTLHKKYGSDTLRFWLDGVQCIGSESALDECRHNGWGVHDCYSGDEVSISCESNETTTTGPPSTTRPRSTLATDRETSRVPSSSTPRPVFQNYTISTTGLSTSSVAEQQSSSSEHRALALGILAALVAIIAFVFATLYFRARHEIAKLKNTSSASYSRPTIETASSLVDEDDTCLQSP
jgi:hypothetical protein